MISHGWKSLGTNKFAGAGSTTSVTEIATTIESPHFIDCSAAQFALISYFATVSNALNVFAVWGTQGSHESGQSNDFYVNHKIALVSPDGSPAVSYALPAGLIDGFPSGASNYQIGSITSDGNGITDGPTLFGIFANLSGTRGLQVNNAANTGEINDPSYYYSNLGDVVGPSWLAIPCGPFDYIQVVYTAGAACTAGALVNLLS